MAEISQANSGRAMPDAHTLEHCAKALWEHQTTPGWRRNNPWDSDDKFARYARGVAVERASAVLQALAELLPANPEPEDAARGRVCESCGVQVGAEMFCSDECADAADA